MALIKLHSNYLFMFLFHLIHCESDVGRDDILFTFASPEPRKRREEVVPGVGCWIQWPLRTPILLTSGSHIHKRMSVLTHTCMHTHDLGGLVPKSSEQPVLPSLPYLEPSRPYIEQWSMGDTDCHPLSA